MSILKGVGIGEGPTSGVRGGGDMANLVMVLAGLGGVPLVMMGGPS